MSIDEQKDADAPEKLMPDGEGHHQVWYPVALSSDVAKGHRIGMEFCDGKIVVFRGEDGNARVFSARCPHLGASLAVGKVIGNDIQCGFHHWQFGSNGKCTLIPTGDKIPPGAMVLSLPVEERYGIIWVFFGHKPLYELPSFPGLDESNAVFRAASVVTGHIGGQPWLYASNAVDFGHFNAVHGLGEVKADVIWHEFGPEWDADFERDGLEKFNMHQRMWGVGGNLIINTGADGEVVHYIASSTPMGSRGLVIFLCTGATKGPDAETRVEDRLNLYVTLVGEDLELLRSIEPGPNVVTQSDRELVRFMLYVKAYPRARMADLEADVRLGRVPAACD